MLGFIRSMVLLDDVVLGWVGLLVVVNGLAPLVFLDTVEGRMVLAAFVAGFFLQIAIYESLGFVRLLGLGHALWLPMVAWLALRLPAAELLSPFGVWLAAVISVDVISLGIDATDVVRYLRGERLPHLPEAG